MSIHLPKYALTVPSETTQFRHLGSELRELGESIEAALAAFDYNGADPNLVLARVDALETKTPDRAWQTIGLAPGYTGTIKLRQKNGLVEIRFDISGSFPTSDTAYSAAIPDALRPSTEGTGLQSLATYLNPDTAREQGTVYMEAASGTLCGASPAIAMSRVRGSGSWIPK